MRDNLRLYHTVFEQICQWLPEERITRLRNLALFLTGLYLGRTVHLPKIVRKWPVLGKIPSLENRLRRFVSNQRVSERVYYRPVAEQLLQAFAGQPIRLIIDCSKVGFQHRVMTVSIAYRKRALPLAWSVHEGHNGLIKASEQIALLRYVAGLLPRQCTVVLIGDAGFHSVELMRWLGRNHWQFVIRHPGYRFVRPADGHWIKPGDIPLSPGQTHTVGWVRVTQTHDYGWLWLVLHWQRGEDEPWFLLSNQPDTRWIIRAYKIRMWTEEMYGDMKGHGFDLQATHLRHTDRISRLFLAVCLVFVWLITLGAWVVKRGYRHLVDRKDRRDKSYFRIGWDWLERLLRLGQPLRLQFKPYP